jgi:hypothetical protein
MKQVLLLTALFLSIATIPQPKLEDFGLPELHKIKAATLSPSYGCQAPGEQGYQNTALFLSSLSRRRNSPELVFSGPCGAQDAVYSMTAGDNVGLIADLGEIPLEKVTAQLALNTKGVDSFDLYSKFAQMSKVQLGHTYAVLVSGAEIRSFYVFTVTGHVPHKRLDLMYAVKDFQILGLRAQSPGFSWSEENRMDIAGK